MLQARAGKLACPTQQGGMGILLNQHHLADVVSHTGLRSPSSASNKQLLSGELIGGWVAVVGSAAGVLCGSRAALEAANGLGQGRVCAWCHVHDLQPYQAHLDKGLHICLQHARVLRPAAVIAWIIQIATPPRSLTAASQLSSTASVAGKEGAHLKPSIVVIGELPHVAGGLRNGAVAQATRVSVRDP